MAKPSPSDLITVTEAAKILGVGERQARKLIGGLPTAVQIGGSWVVKRSDLASIPKVRKPGPKPASD
jgi:excisionase family DNA binding protein